MNRQDHSLILKCSQAIKSADLHAANMRFKRGGGAKTGFMKDALVLHYWN